MKPPVPNGIISAAATAAPSCEIPSRRSMYLRVAFSVGTVSVALSVNPLSVENSLTGTPRLNPMPSKLLSAIELEKVTWPVP